MAISPDGNTIYAGGSFTTIGGTTRNRIASIKVSDGTLNGWDPSSDNTVYALAISPDGNTIYAGGDFTTIGGQTRNRIAALNATDGTATTWDPDANYLIRAFAIYNDQIYAGGNFTIIGGEKRNNIAAIDVTTGNLTDWNPNADNSVTTLLISPDGNTIYAGGAFKNIGGQARSCIAALDKIAGTATAWDPNVTLGSGGTVYSLLIYNNTVYIGGYFSKIGTETRKAIGAIDINSGNATAWAPNTNDYEKVYSLVISSDGNTIYAGGNFTTIGGQTRNMIAALDTTINTNNATDWNPDLTGGGVSTLLLSENILYVGGSFTNIGGAARNRIAALDTTINTNNATDWNPDANGTINNILVSANGKTVYVAGDFTTICGVRRSGIVAIDAETGNILEN